MKTHFELLQTKNEDGCPEEKLLADVKGSQVIINEMIQSPKEVTKILITLPDHLSKMAAETIATALLEEGEEATAHDIIIAFGDRSTVADNGDYEVESNHETLGEAADSYIADGDWGGGRTTVWLDVSAWHRWTLGDLTVDGERESWSVEIEPTEPKCSEGHEHYWVAPHSVVGGIRQNPGVWGHIYGVVIHEVCRYCGCRRTTDTWAQRPGETGLTSVTYAKLGEHDMSEEWLAWSEEEEK